ncbi:MAG: hypothetical protein AUG91_02505 [Actinobacteria bacterium 13_1_20CM_4_69_9]|nr:MAG: hypothetical protein AUG91_02505 [Actinobacteria bacterium 13_1_20CM_4_69_9]
MVGQLRESSKAFRDVFGNPALRRVELAWAASIFGTWAYGIAVVVYAFEQGGATAVGVVGLARWLSAAAVSPFAALLGDRYDKRLVMVSSDLARVVLIGAAAAAVYTDSPPLVVYVLAALVGVAATAFRPAEAALVPTLARTPEELTAANVTASTIESIGIFGGPAIGGLLLAATGPATVFAVTAGLLLVSAALLLGIRPAPEPEPAGRHEESIREELLAGFRAIVGERRLRLLVGLFSAQTFVDGMLSVLIVVVAFDLLGLFAGQAAIALDLLQRARRAQATLDDRGELAVLARVAQKLEQRRDEGGAALALLSALERVLE